jgi:hypothetical protein
LLILTPRPGDDARPEGRSAAARPPPSGLIAPRATRAQLRLSLSDAGPRAGRRSPAPSVRAPRRGPRP